MHRQCASCIAALVLVLGIAAPASPQARDRPAKGKLLVASEGLLDPNFARTVVLLLEYGESGALGVVLNRPTEGTLADLLPDSEWASHARDPIHLGGPVAINQALMLYSRSEKAPDQRHVLGDVHTGWDLELLERLVVEPGPQEKVRVYVGYAGWAPDQLAAEIERGGWYVLPATEATIFSDKNDELWRELIERTRTRIAFAEALVANGQPAIR